MREPWMSDPAFRKLMTRGDLFDPNRQLVSLGRNFEHPVRGETPILIDPQVMAATSRVYLSDDDLARALRENGARTASIDDARQLIEQYFHSKGLLIGFGGFAQAGHRSAVAAWAIIKVYQFLSEMNRLPILSIDGGSGMGIPGLNGYIAPFFGVPTLGISSLQGLKTLAPRTHSMVWRTLHTERQELVGSLADIFVCGAGAEGTRNKCVVALKNGAVALLLAVPGYGPSTLINEFMQHREVRSAAKEGKTRRFFVCDSLDQWEDRVRQAVEAHDMTVRRSRPVRLGVVGQLFAP